MPRVLIATTDTRGIVPFARSLRELGYTLVVANQRVRSVLESSGVQFTSLEDATGPVVHQRDELCWFHPQVLGSLFHFDNTMEEVPEPFELLVVGPPRLLGVASEGFSNPYQVLGKLDEEMLALFAAIRNFREIAIITSPDQYQAIVTELEMMAKQSGEALSEKTHAELANTAIQLFMQGTIQLAFWFTKNQYHMDK